VETVIRRPSQDCAGTNLSILLMLLIVYFKRIKMKIFDIVYFLSPGNLFTRDDREPLGGDKHNTSKNFALSSALLSAEDMIQIIW
jgi:hypothetical protein